MPSKEQSAEVPSWRMALAPGEAHHFSRTPGWWDLRDLGADGDDVPGVRAALLRALPPLLAAGHVLDLGAGTGTLVVSLAHYYPGLRYTLMDANPAALQRATEKLSGLAVVTIVEAVEPMSAAPLPGGPYDLVTSSIALHDIARPAVPDDQAGQARHAEEHQSLLRRIFRSLRPGGHLVYADAMRPRFRVREHLSHLADAGFGETDCAYVQNQFLVVGGQRPQ